MLPLAGKPMIQRVYDRLTLAGSLTKIIVATSDEDSDDLIEAYCSRQEIPCFRGPLENVAARMLMCAEREGADSFVRVSGDSPLIDPVLVDFGVSLHLENLCDLSTNVQVRSYPKGQSVEVIRTESLASACGAMTDARDREHVTRYFYNHSEKFKVVNFLSSEPMEEVQLSVDTLEDRKTIDAIFKRAGANVGWERAATLKLEMAS